MARKQKPKKRKFQARPRKMDKIDTFIDEIEALQEQGIVADSSQIATDIEQRALEHETESVLEDIKRLKEEIRAQTTPNTARSMESREKYERMARMYGGDPTATQIRQKPKSAIQDRILGKYLNHLDTPGLSFHMRAAIGTVKEYRLMDYFEAQAFIEYCRENLPHLLDNDNSGKGVCEDFWEDI